jgi:formylglycine-generating enzyme required for sulfatase activity
LALAALIFLIRQASERPIPIERAPLSGFSIARYEVSNREFLRFVEQNPGWRRDRIDPELHDGDYLGHWISPTAYPPGLADHPVTRVPWHAARAFCAWAGGDLPTRDEWQRAAHAAESVYPWGPADLSGPARMNFCDSACEGAQRSVNPRSPELNDRYPGTAPVTAFPGGRTREGVFNLSGNVWEWCLDASAEERVTMGGSYSATFEECTTDEPAWEPARLCAPDGGFRCVWRSR